MIELTGSTSELVMAVTLVWLMITVAMLLGIIETSGKSRLAALKWAVTFQLKLVVVAVITIAGVFLGIWAIMVVLSAIAPFWAAL